jgi:hypothetical protein
MSYPAAYWQIIAWADYNCVGGSLRKALWRLPEKVYLDQMAIVTALRLLSDSGLSLSSMSRRR